MKAAGISEIKQELEHRPAKEITALCLRLARFKKENKELLSYLLFEAHNTEAYTEDVKAFMNNAFKEIHTGNMYLAKKSLRSLLRKVNKYIQYTGDKQTEAVLLMHYCSLLKHSGIALQKSAALNNMYARQLKKIQTAVTALHADIQHDLMKEMKRLL